jgi:hypothetical protein
VQQHRELQLGFRVDDTPPVQLVILVAENAPRAIEKTPHARNP